MPTRTLREEPCVSGAASDKADKVHFAEAHPGQGYLAPAPGNANATYVPPDSASFFPPPQAMTRNSRPFTMYSDGVAFPEAGSRVSQSSLPVVLSKARS